MQPTAAPSIEPLDSRLAELAFAGQPYGDLATLAGQLASSRAHAWIAGEGGTGKEYVARALARQSDPRAPFVAIHCGAAAEEALQRALHAPGDARGGMLFLDAVESLDEAAQAALLDALLRLPATTSGVRILSATTLPADAAHGLREDLYQRLQMVQLRLSPLRERRDEIGTIAQALLAHAPDGRVLALSPEAVTRLAEHEWPGNLRELENVIRRARLLARGSEIEAGDLQIDARGLDRPRNGEDPVAAALRPLARSGLRLERVELAYIHATLDQMAGNKTRAAAALGIDRKTLYRKLAQ